MSTANSTTPLSNRDGTASRRAHVCISALLLLLPLLTYIQTVTFDFVNFDDPDWVTSNIHVVTGLEWDNVCWAFSTRAVERTANWHPLTWLSLMADVELFGIHPAGFHWTNTLMHSVNSYLLYAVLFSMTRQAWPSAFAAAIFAVHPLHVESVAWITERKDVLSTLFGFAAIRSWVVYVRNSKWTYYWGAVGLFAASLLSKQMLVTLPFVLLLFNYWPLGRQQWRRNFIEIVPFLVLTIVFCIVTVTAQNTAETIAPVDQFPLTNRLMNSIDSYFFYLQCTFWPTELAVFYPLEPENLSVISMCLKMAFLITITGTCFYLRCSHPYGLVGWLFYLGTLVPVIGIVQIGAQRAADRYMYVPMTGIAIALSWFLAALLRPLPRIRNVSAVVCIVMLVALTSAQLRHWKGSVELFFHAAQVTSGSVSVEGNLGSALLIQGRYKDASSSLRKTLRRDPNHWQSNCNMAVTLAGLGQLNESREYCRRCQALAPEPVDNLQPVADALQDGTSAEELIAAVNGYRAAIRPIVNLAVSRYHLGNECWRNGRTDRAIEHYQQAIELDLRSVKPRIMLANAFAKTKNIPAAIDALSATLELDPDNAMVHFNLGTFHDSDGRSRDAATSFERAHILDPSDEATRRRLSLTLVSIATQQLNQGHHDAALRDIRKAMVVDPFMEIPERFHKYLDNKDGRIE